VILTIFLGVVGLGLMVFIHELGHFVAAKLAGVRVEVFSLGWGPKLVGFTRGGTSYQISWFPIGGYCKMKGEIAPGLAGGEGAVGAEGAAGAGALPAEKGSFLSASPWRRIAIAMFGPLFNLLFAVLVFTAIWWVGFRVYSADNRIAVATDYTLDRFPEPPPATVAGLRTGDRVVAIDGRPVEKFQDILEKVTVSSGRQLLFTVERESVESPGKIETLTLALTPALDKSSGAGRVGIYAWTDPLIQTVAPGSAAALAGLRSGDRILAAAGRETRNVIDLLQELASKPGKLVLRYEREGVEQTVPLVLSYDPKGSANLGIDFLSRSYRSPRLGLCGAFLKSLEETASTISLTVKGIGLLFRGISLRNAVAGPLRITYYIGSAATSGFQLGIGIGVVSFFRFLSFLSVTLFLMNLLPIPAMDGGQIALFAVELVRGKPVRSRMIWRLQLVGFSLLIILSLFITFSDILFFIGR
jgi:regulator of sigma E protease